MTRITIDIETIGPQDPGVQASIREALLEQDPPASIKRGDKNTQALDQAGFLGAYQAAKNKGSWLEENWNSEPAIIDARVDVAIRNAATDTLYAEPIVIGFAIDDDQVEIISLKGRNIAGTVESRPDNADPGECIGGFQQGQPGESGQSSPWSLLAHFNAALDGVADPVWIGHNITGFDLPVLANAFRRLDVIPPPCFPKFHRGRPRGRIYDTMLECAGKTPFISAKTAAAAYSLPSYKDISWQGEPMDGSRVYDAYLAGEWDLLEAYCRSDVEHERQLAFTISQGWRAIEDTGFTPARVRGAELLETIAGLPNRTLKFQTLIQRLEADGIIDKPVAAGLLAE